ncbi:MAG TPA: N-methyl-L-tryptophan oxidase [Rhizomicrobium sp.]|nr:N-methyl-L-tryptophan oxidase [Rhizomicrobium sp.]
MQQLRYDAIVVGLGAMGAAATYQLAKRGARVLGIDRYAPPHALGSTHGETRVTRLAIGEGAQYSPLVMRSHQIWRGIERETGVELLNECGGLFISSDNKVAITHVEGFFANTVAAAEKFGIAHEVLDAAAIRRRYPQFAVADDEYGYYEPTAGFVRPEACVAAQLALAEKHGATLRLNEKVLSLDEGSVATERGTYAADRIVLAAGAWLPALAGLERLFKIHRQVQFWFEARGDFAPGRFPVFIWELPKGRQGIYGFPSLDGASSKVATERYETTTAPNAVDGVGEDERAAMQALIAPYLPGVGPRVVRASTCLYTVTPDNGFVIDQLGRTIVASPCSGHGFKHSAAIGEALAELATGAKPAQDLSPFRISRFAS